MLQFSLENNSELALYGRLSSAQTFRPDTAMLALVPCYVHGSTKAQFFPSQCLMLHRPAIRLPK